MGLFGLFNQKNKVKEKIIKKYYRDYPEIPYISDERENGWIEKAEMFPDQSIIPKSTMTRFADGLLPGHVYMLYWLDKYTNKRVPVYFEYKYGVDFEKEKDFLIDAGFLDETNKPTLRGKEAIQNHYEIVENHNIKKTARTIENITEEILLQKESLKRNGFKRYKIISCNDACEVCKAYDGKNFALSKMVIGKNAPPFHDGCKCSISAYESKMN